MSMITISLLIVLACTVITGLLIVWAIKEREDAEDSIKAIFVTFFSVCLIWSAGIVSIILCLIKYFAER